MGIAGMILGIIAVVFAFIPLVGVFIAWPCVAVGLPLSGVGFYRNRKAGQGTGMAIAGIATNAVGFVLVLIASIAMGAVVSEF